MNYKKYRVYINTPAGGFVAAASNTVNNLVQLVRYWMESTSVGMSLDEEVKGTVSIHTLNPETGAYVRGSGKSFEDKRDIITKLREMGAR